MNKKEIYELLTSNPAFHLATMEGDQPRVRGMLLYQADEKGIVFHTSAAKPLYSQILKNPKAELCFWEPKQNLQLRITGTLEIVKDPAFQDEIYNHPTRAFLKGFKESMSEAEFYENFIVFRMRGGIVQPWTMQTNMDPAPSITLD